MQEYYNLTPFILLLLSIFIKYFNFSELLNSKDIIFILCNQYSCIFPTHLPPVIHSFLYDFASTGIIFILSKERPLPPIKIKNKKEHYLVVSFVYLGTFSEALSAVNSIFSCKLLHSTFIFWGFFGQATLHVGS